MRQLSISETLEVSGGILFQAYANSQFVRSSADLQEIYGNQGYGEAGPVGQLHCVESTSVTLTTTTTASGEGFVCSFTTAPPFVTCTNTLSAPKVERSSVVSTTITCTKD